MPVLWFILVILLLGIVLLLAGAWNPPEFQDEIVSGSPEASGTPILEPGQRLKVLSWNLQYLASKNYWMFYDGGPDSGPSREHMAQTLEEVARIIRDEDPDIVLLQELDEGSKRTYRVNQLQLLQEKLDRPFPFQAQSFYWKAAFVPHPKLFGPIGVKLAVLSRFSIESATRHALPSITTDDALTRRFKPRRAVLEVRLPVQGQKSLTLLTTHLSAFAQGSNTMELQVARVLSRIQHRQTNEEPWILGGDFNLLPDQAAYDRLPPLEKKLFNPKSELEPLFGKFPSIPAPEDICSAEFSSWFTHFPNHPAISGPDRVIDYIFYSPLLTLDEKYIRQADTLGISDHCPVIASFFLPTEDSASQAEPL